MSSTKAKPVVKYMHTIDSKPGHYIGGQICFASWSRPITLCDSLNQIRKEERASLEWRELKGFANRSEYGYVRVRV